MPTALSEEEARALLGDDVLGPREVEAVFGVGVHGETLRHVPFSREALVAAKNAGEMLIARITHGSGGAPLTLLQMLLQFPDAFDKRLLRQVGYQLKDEWGIELEPLAATDTCAPGWALVRKEILDGSGNLAYEEQDAVLRACAQRLGIPATALRRRTAVETVYDTLLYFGARRVRLLEKSWDWSGSRTLDGGYLTVGGFNASGMQIVGYSRAIRYGGLGVCSTRGPVG
jgi:hypothetical protein